MKKLDKRFGLSKSPRKDISGSKFGNWTLLKISHAKRYVAKTGKHKGHKTVVWYYLCECSCGNKSDVGWPDINQGKSTKCKECHLKEYIVNSQSGIRRFGKENSNYKGSEDVPGRWLSRIKKNAETRSISFNLSIKHLQKQWVKQKGLCHYTGLPLQFSKEGCVQDTNNHISLIASVDRIDSECGYEPKNIVWASKTINKLKMDLPHNLFVKLCEMVYIHSNRGMK